MEKLLCHDTQTRPRCRKCFSQMDDLNCTYGPLCGRTSEGILFVPRSWRPICRSHSQQPLVAHHQMPSCILKAKQFKATKHSLGARFQEGTFLCRPLQSSAASIVLGRIVWFSLYLLKLCPQMSSVSRDFHFEYLLLWDKVRCWPSTDRNMDALLLISLSFSQFHISAERSTSRPSHAWVFRVLLSVATKHLDEATHISMPWLIQIHCWKADFRSHAFSETSSVALESWRHRLCWVL